MLQNKKEKIDFLIRDKEREMLDLPETIIDEIFERALKSF